MSNGRIVGVDNPTTIAVANGRFSARDIYEKRKPINWPTADDPYAAYVVALYHLDADTKNAVTSGGAGDLVLGSAGALSATQSRWGTNSLAMTAAVNTYAHGSNSSAWAFGTGDYAIEWWCYPTALNQVAVLLDLRIGVAVGIQPVIFLNNDETVRLYLNGADRIVSAAGIYVANSWQYGGLARVSGNTRLYWGTSGTAAQLGSTYADTNSYAAGILTLGSGGDNSQRFAGYGSDVRITKGSGRGMSGTTVTVPTAAFNSI